MNIVNSVKKKRFIATSLHPSCEPISFRLKDFGAVGPKVRAQRPIEILFVCVRDTKEDVGSAITSWLGDKKIRLEFEKCINYRIYSISKLTRPVDRTAVTLELITSYLGNTHPVKI